jgi:hypothetical protein
VPDFTETTFKNPLMGSVHDSHPQTRTASRSRCFERGYHRGPDHEGQCLDCGGRAGLSFRTEAEIPKARPVYDERPKVVAHNEHATFDELMAERGLTPEEHAKAQAERAKILAGEEVEPISLNKEQATKVGEAYLRAVKTPENVKKWCKELDIPLVADGGVYLHLEAKLTAAEKKIEDLKGQLAEAQSKVPVETATENKGQTFKHQVHADHEGGM